MGTQKKEINMFKKRLESGRSMVEMLGVLAIIGVLSIGGIAGYTMSMRRHRANQVVDALNKYAVILYGVCQQKVMDQEAKYVINNGKTFTYCDNSNLPSYENTDLHPISEISKFDAIEVKMSLDPPVVWMEPYFHDPAICKTTASITGYTSGPCQPYLSVEFKMN